MRLRCQCQRPPAGRLGAIRPARLIAASVAAVVLGVLSLAVSAPSASAQTACWKQIQDDWVNDGLIQGVYPLHCYGEAIKHVPNDLAAVHGDHRRHHRRHGSGRLETQDDCQGTHSPQPQSAGQPERPGQRRLQPAIDKLGPTNSDSIPLPF